MEASIRQERGWVPPSTLPLTVAGVTQLFLIQASEAAGDPHLASKVPTLAPVASVLLTSPVIPLPELLLPHQCKQSLGLNNRALGRQQPPYIAKGNVLGVSLWSQNKTQQCLPEL